MFCVFSGGSQTILNGDFEINDVSSAVSPYTGTFTITQFNNLVPHVYVFEGQAYYPMSLFSSVTGPQTNNELPQSGEWYLGFSAGGVSEGGSNNIPIEFSLELSDSLVVGKNYKLSFYDGARPQHCAPTIEIGVSTNYDDFGTSIYTGGTTPYEGWALRVIEFVAPNNGKYITVKGNHSPCQVSLRSWARVDNFCLSIDTFCVELPEFSMPNVFTPNGDGVNDIFKPIKFKGMNQGKMIILNRWGNTVFETNDITNGWDGTYNSTPCTEGVYYWKVVYTDIFEETKTEHGFFTLIR